MVTEIPTAGPFTNATRGLGKSIKQPTNSLQKWKYENIFKCSKAALWKYVQARLYETLTNSSSQAGCFHITQKHLPYQIHPGHPSEGYLMEAHRVSPLV